MSSTSQMLSCYRTKFIWSWDQVEELSCLIGSEPTIPIHQRDHSLVSPKTYQNFTSNIHSPLWSFSCIEVSWMKRKKKMLTTPGTSWEEMGWELPGPHSNSGSERKAKKYAGRRTQGINSCGSVPMIVLWLVEFPPSECRMDLWVSFNE